jgi:uncharacterized membrane protein YfcA
MSLGEVHLGLVVAGALGGFLVGLTGMGGGAVLTPLLVLVFGIDPLTAVSSDLVVSLGMKPVGGAVHWRHGTVRTDIVRWLVVGSVPAAVAGAALLSRLDADRLEPLLRRALGIALVASAASMIARTRLLRGRSPIGAPPVRPLPTALVGVIGGVLVGLTGVGSGSLMIALLLPLYPGLTSAEMVGTDLVQAVPLVAAAVLGHLLFGDVNLGLTVTLLIGALPGVALGARLSSRAPDRIVRPAIATVLLTSGCKLLQVI